MVKKPHDWEKFFENLKKTKSIKVAFSAYSVVGFLLIVGIGYKANKWFFLLSLLIYLAFTLTWAMFIIKIDRKIRQGKVEFNPYSFHNRVCNFYAIAMIIMLFTHLNIMLRLGSSDLPKELVDKTISYSSLAYIVGFALFALIYYYYFVKDKLIEK